jgi:hypothetical protein
VSADAVAWSIPKSGRFISVRAELVEALSFLFRKQEVRPFDRLRANGFKRIRYNLPTL